MIQLIVSFKKAFVYKTWQTDLTHNVIQFSLSDFDGANVNLLGVCVITGKY